ncbi:agrin-like [Diadema antillarum]|uniref:agrin-like n=1 Tax=Diadema antillarum TaxID=105358 RepID=UPI003A88515B
MKVLLFFVCLFAVYSPSLSQRETFSVPESSEETSEEVGMWTTAAPAARNTVPMRFPNDPVTLPPEGAMPYPCPQRCGASSKRVCGTDGRTYDSGCHMRMEGCRTRDRTLMVNYVGPCQCPESCPMVYEPVCATSRRQGFGRERTYSSECEMQKDACRHNDKSVAVSYNGECAAALTGRCRIQCDSVYDPVCSSTNVTYRSECELRRHRCISQVRSLSVAYSGACPHAPIRCPNLCQPAKDPHCGSDGVTYSSLCEYGVAACKDPTLRLRYAGPCVPGTVDPCARICDSFEDPVCGTDGETYWNPCLLQLAHCKDPTITLAFRGHCPGTTRNIGNAVPVGRRRYYTAYGAKSAFMGFP